MFLGPGESAIIYSALDSCVVFLTVLFAGSVTAAARAKPWLNQVSSEPCFPASALLNYPKLSRPSTTCLYPSQLGESPAPRLPVSDSTFWAECEAEMQSLTAISSLDPLEDFFGDEYYATLAAALHL